MLRRFILITGYLIGYWRKDSGTDVVRPELDPFPQRRLTQKQIDAISVEISKADPSTIIFVNNYSQESVRYQRLYESILKSHGWIIQNVCIPGHRNILDNIKIGCIGEGNPSYISLLNGLRSANIEFDESEFDFNRMTDIAIEVGSIHMSDYQVYVDTLPFRGLGDY